MTIFCQISSSLTNKYIIKISYAILFRFLDFQSGRKAKFANFIFFLAIDVNIVILIIFIGKNILNQISFANLTCAPNNQRFSICAFIPIYTFSCRQSFHNYRSFHSLIIHEIKIVLREFIYYLHFFQCFVWYYLHLFKCYFVDGALSEYFNKYNSSLGERTIVLTPII